MNGSFWKSWKGGAVVPKKYLLFRAFLLRQLIYFRRYFMNSLGGMLTLFLVFLLIFGGYQGLSGPGGLKGDTAEVLVVGYVLWFFLYTTYQDVAQYIRTESLTGTLEQLYMSVHGFGWVMGASVLAAFLTNLVLVALLLWFAMSVTGTMLNVNLPALFPVIFGTLLGPLGLGFVVAGLTLLFQRIDSYTQMVQFLLIGLVALPAEQVAWMRLLPGSFGAALAREIMVRGKGVMEIGLGNYLLLFVIGIVHLLLGYGVYKLCEGKAMSRGQLGHY